MPAPQYSPLSARAQARFLKGHNDIDVFVEDVKTHNLYVRLINRILEPRFAISSVISLNGRKNVIDACARDQAPRGRPRLYIVDGDLDLLAGIGKRRLRHLYRLGVYCSENLVATEFAAVQVGQDACASEPYDQLRTKLRIETLLNKAERQLAPLFVVYAVIHRLSLRIHEDTASFPVHHLLRVPNDPWSLSSTLIRARMNVLIQAIQAAGISRRKYLSTRRAIQRHIASANTPLRHTVSGKSYLLPLIGLQLKAEARLQAPLHSLAVRLANFAEKDVDPGLVRAIQRARRSG